MANKYRAEAEFSARGETWLLRWDWNAAVEFESAAGRCLSEALSEVAAGKLSATSLRAMLWAGLRAERPRVTLEEAGGLLAELGHKRAMELCGSALRYFFPEIADAPPGDADPQSPAPST